MPSGGFESARHLRPQGPIPAGAPDSHRATRPSRSCAATENFVDNAVLRYEDFRCFPTSENHCNDWSPNCATPTTSMLPSGGLVSTKGLVRVSPSLHAPRLVSIERPSVPRSSSLVLRAARGHGKPRVARKGIPLEPNYASAWLRRSSTSACRSTWLGHVDELDAGNVQVAGLGIDASDWTSVDGSPTDGNGCVVQRAHAAVRADPVLTEVTTTPASKCPMQDRDLRSSCATKPPCGIDHALGKKRLHRPGGRKVRVKFVAKPFVGCRIFAGKNYLSGRESMPQAI